MRSDFVCNSNSVGIAASGAICGCPQFGFPRLRDFAGIVWEDGLIFMHAQVTWKMAQLGHLAVDF